MKTLIALLPKKFQSLLSILFFLTISPTVVNAQFEKLIASLSLEEKVGQMTQIDLGVIAKGAPCALTQPQTIDTNKLRIAFEKYHVGSILNVGCGSGTISLENWKQIHSDIATANKKYLPQVPVVFGIDAIHGANYTKGATMFPQQIGQAATWNPDLITQASEITAYEVRASGIPWNFSPVLDLGRQPLWSRFFETYGEDVYLAKSMASACIRGYQGVPTLLGIPRWNSMDQTESLHMEGASTVGIDPYHVSACMKHFLGYSYPLSGKDRTPAWISDRELREYFLPTFEKAIDEGALTVMINSGEINGTPVHINPDILTKLLRTELGFKGLAVTDWEDIYKLHTTHKVAASLREAVKLAINAGIDMSMTPNDYQFTDLLIDLVKAGEVPMSRINESVARILYVKQQLGLFNPTTTQYANFASEEHQKAALAAAEESITLLKNQNSILPLNPNQNLFIFGNAANDLNILNGAWSNTWQGTDSQYQHNPKYPTILEDLLGNNAWQGIKNGHITYLHGADINKLLTKKYRKEISSTPCVAILCLGEKPGTEIPGNINDLESEIDPNDRAIFDYFKSINIPIVLVLVTGRPRIVTEIANASQAVIQAYLPGNSGGTAIVNVLLGTTNPSGKLPYTYPKFAGDVVHYDHKNAEKNDILFGTKAYDPLFDFGHGLSYSSFKMTDLNISEAEFPSVVKNGNPIKKNLDGKGFQCRVKVSNTGKMAGKEVVQVYYRDEFASITPSSKKLCGFVKTPLLQPGESYLADIWIPLSNLSFINKDLQRIVEPGDITFMVGAQNQTITLK
ncbi:MAG: beta-glucosidase [Flavobacteriales bacterium]|nr:MAG: beta-glucosidase [Flavobacteriales bacterium]